jgi:hypothetical protein
MNYQNLKTGDNSKNLSIVLTMEEIKILHNACVDILNEFPEMIGYKKAQESLEDIILFNEATLNHKNK